MARAGVNKRVLEGFGGRVVCFMSDPDVAAEARERGETRATVSMERAAGLDGPVVLALGNAPTALVRACQLMEEGRLRPELVIGVPVGFVNVVESKELLLSMGGEHIVARGRKGEQHRRRHLQRPALPGLRRPERVIREVRYHGESASDGLLWDQLS